MTPIGLMGILVLTHGLLALAAYAIGESVGRGLGYQIGLETGRLSQQMYVSKLEDELADAEDQLETLSQESQK